MRPLRAPALLLIIVPPLAPLASCLAEDSRYGAPSGSPNQACFGGDCAEEDPCAHPGPGCPCEVEGEQLVCGEVTSEVAGQLVCGMGYSVCSEGVWGACILNNTITLAPKAPSPGPGLGTASLGSASACAQNPCDPYCMQFPDTPTGLTNDAGIVETDGGLSLPGNTSNGGGQVGCTGGVTASCAHSICAQGTKLTVGCDNTQGQPALNCVKAICQTKPSCCSGTWDASCVAAVTTTCQLSCGSLNGTCVLCYKDSIDHDGDGYAWTNGDCKDCDPNVNPGAYDFPGNGVDEDCSGAPDDEVKECDNNLALSSNTAMDYARAIGLCRTTTAGATGANKTWGVISAKLVQADATSTPHSLSYGILGAFGPNNVPWEGKKMAAFSSGTARAPSDPGWVNPNGQSGSYNQNKACAYPPGFPKNKQGCPSSAGQAYDSTGLLLQIRVPTNAQSLSFKFDFFSTEYPEWVCTAYNDAFVALLKTAAQPPNPPQNAGNISFDSQSNPVNVNVGFFTLTTGPKLQGTAMDGTCSGQPCGGATDWLQTSAPVVPGETITLHYSMWDAGDHKWDSTVLIDDFRWSVSPAAIQTLPPPPPPVVTYSDGYFTRDYDLTGVCPADTVPFWGLWSWSAVTPGNAYIDFTVQTAATAAELPNAPKDSLLFSDPPGPAALSGSPAVARTTPLNTSAGSAVVHDTLVAKGRTLNLPFLRVVSHLAPTSDKLAAPTLSAWNLQIDCRPHD